MKKHFILFAFAALVIGGCNNQAKNSAVTVKPDFEKFRNEFIDKLWRLYPGWATAAGFHNYDSVLVLPDDAQRKRELDFADWCDRELKGYTFDSLSANDKTDYKLVQDFAKGIRFGISEFKAYEWDPSSYNVGENIFNVIDYQGAPLNQRLENISKKLTAVPAYFEAAKKNIRRPTIEHTNLGAKQNEGSLTILTKMLADSVKNSSLSAAEREALTKNIAEAKSAIEDYSQWLQGLLKQDSSNFRSFRIGKELYAKKFALDIGSHYSSDEMYKIAEARKAYLHADMSRLTDELWGKYFGQQKAPADTLQKIKMMIDKISVQHCKREDFLKTIEQQLPELVAFINAHHIIDLDSTKPLKVRKTPDYAAGVAGAGINSPGPYDIGGTTYYNVTPLTNYSPEKAESYLREYNNYVLQILNIHEAIPGHYTQGIYAAKSPSIIKAVLGNGAMVEGWACYVERMMLEQGYNPSAEMQLFYDKWNLRELCNFILDYNIQCNNWSKELVMHLLVEEAFQQKAESEEKWNRATLTQVQLTSYFTGLTEIYELREELKKKQGDKFDLKNFHEQFLSYGSAPVKEIRTLMLGN